MQPRLHHVSGAWVAKSRGQFDQGWDKLREETFARQKALGVIPSDAVLTPRDNALVVWIWEGTVTGSLDELTMQNGIPLTDEIQLQLSERCDV